MRRFAALAACALVCLPTIGAHAFSRIVAQLDEPPSAGGGASQILVQYSDACAKIVALRVVIRGGKTFEEAATQVSRLVADAVGTVRGECAQVERIDVGIATSRSPTQWLSAELTAADGWRLSPTPVGSVPAGYTAFRSSYPWQPGFIRVTPQGEVTGQLPIGEGLTARFEGRVTPGMSGEYISRYQIEGVLHDYSGPVTTVRGAQKQCATSRNGYAYWSSFQWLASSDDTLWQGAGGNHWPCADVNTAGQTFQTSFTIDDSNPFKVVTADSAPPTPAGTDADNIVLAEGEGWRLTTADRFWCSSSASLQLTYDAPDAERLRPLGYAADAYLPAIENVLLPPLRSQCPTANQLAIDFQRSGEASPYERVDYNATPQGLRLKVQRSPLLGLTREQYLASCAGCHATGAGGAPVTGRAEGWDRDRERERQAFAREDPIYHFHGMHCLECSAREIDALLRQIGGTALPEVAQLDAGQQRLADYANDPGPRQLIQSGLLKDGARIAAVYAGTASAGTTRNDLQGLFVAYINEFSRACRALLPANARTVTTTIQVLSHIDYGPDGQTNVYERRPLETIYIDPRYYDKYNAATERPLTVGLYRGIDDAVTRWHDMRALLPNEQYCADPASRQFVENLFQQL